MSCCLTEKILSTVQYHNLVPRLSHWPGNEDKSVLQHLYTTATVGLASNSSIVLLSYILLSLCIDRTTHPAVFVAADTFTVLIVSYSLFA